MARKAFTLNEILIVITIIGVLAGLLFPALAKAREESRKAKCQSNLRQFGVAMQEFSSRDAQGRLCTGASDYMRDGCMDTYGWVADIVNSGSGNVRSMRCPSSILEGSEKLNECFSRENTDFRDGATESLLATGICAENEFGPVTTTGNSWVGTIKGTEDRAELISRALIVRGYDTNYAAGWHLVRGGLLVTSMGDVLLSYANSTFGQKGLGATTGPLRMRSLDRSEIPSANVGILGDAAPGDPRDAIARTSFGYGPSLGRTHFETAVTAGDELFIQQGEYLAESHNDGPAFYDSVTHKLVMAEPGRNVARNRNLSTQVHCEATGDCAPPLGAAGLPTSNTYLQDTTDWFALHNSSINLLMADGSVKVFHDTNNDYFLNPGFPVPSTLSPEEYANIGFRDSTTELPSSKFYAGVFIDNTYRMGNFE